MEMRERMLDEMRSCIRRGKRLPRRPRPEELWEAADQSGESALMLTLEYLAARREALKEIGVYETPAEACECTLGRGIAA